MNPVSSNPNFAIVGQYNTANFGDYITRIPSYCEHDCTYIPYSLGVIQFYLSTLSNALYVDRNPCMYVGKPMFCSVGYYNTYNYGDSFYRVNNYVDADSWYILFGIDFI